MKPQRTIIKMPPKIIVAIVVIMIIFFTVLIFATKYSLRPKMVDLATEIDSAKITMPLNRGFIYLSDTLTISSLSKLLNAPDRFKDWETKGPIIDFDTIPYSYTLGDLKTPYFISKKRNNDTIVVYKKGNKLLFLLTQLND
jgi:hypothetical protein